MTEEFYTESEELCCRGMCARDAAVAMLLICCRCCFVIALAVALFAPRESKHNKTIHSLPYSQTIAIQKLIVNRIIGFGSKGSAGCFVRGIQVISAAASVEQAAKTQQQQQ